MGAFVVERSLSSGGTAAVVVAHTAVDPRVRVALKFLHPHLAEDEEMLDMLRAEAALLTGITHPNVARCYGFDLWGGLPYLALELVEGATLGRLVAALRAEGRAMPVPVAIAIAIRVAAALAAAHEARDASGRSMAIVHRDVSPSNVLVSRDGVVKLIDFGVARSTQRTRSTQVGTFKGKAGYAAPEQVRGTTIDHRTDLYALGVLAWELCTMQRLFPGSTLDALRARFEPGGVPRVDEVSPSVSTQIADAIAWALAERTTERPASARVLAEALLAACPAALRVTDAELAELVALARRRDEPALYEEHTSFDETADELLGSDEHDAEPEELPPLATVVSEPDEVLFPDTPETTPLEASEPGHLHDDVTPLVGVVPTMIHEAVSERVTRRGDITRERELPPEPELDDATLATKGGPALSQHELDMLALFPETRPGTAVPPDPELHRETTVPLSVPRHARAELDAPRFPPAPAEARPRPSARTLAMAVIALALATFAIAWVVLR